MPAISKTMEYRAVSKKRSRKPEVGGIINNQGMGKKNKLLTLVFVGLAAGYFLLSTFLPADPQVLAKYELTANAFRVINLTVSIPLVIIWLSAFYGFLRFKSYANKVKASAEGRPFNQLADGLMVLAFSLPINSVLSTLSTYYAIHHKNSLATSTIVRGYLTVAFSLIAFTLLNRGASNLALTLKYRRNPKLSLIQYNDLIIIVLASIFSWLIISRSVSQSSGKVIYYLSDWQIIITLAIPYLFAWHHGVIASSKLFLYKNKVKGKVYKDSFGDLAKGVGVIVLVSVLIQLITIVSVRLTRLHLTPLLLIVYGLLIVYALGFGMVARGAKRLKKIEEV